MILDDFITAIFLGQRKYKISHIVLEHFQHRQRVPNGTDLVLLVVV